MLMIQLAIVGTAFVCGYASTDEDKDRLHRGITFAVVAGMIVIGTVRGIGD